MTIEEALSRRTCSRCFTAKPVEEFPFTCGRGVTYRRSWCRDCLDAYYREYRQRGKEARRAPGN